MKEIRTEDAVGHVLCHDITQIIKDEKKGVLFKKGHIVREEDIPALLSVGKEHLYVWEKQEGILHENEAAEILYRISADIHMHGSDIKEGKIELIADCDGVLKIRRDALLAVNSLGEMMIASRHGDFPVKKGDKIAGTRIIPLVIEKTKMDKAEKVAGTKPIFSILPYRSKKVGIITTGSEVQKGLIKDTFTPVLKEKLDEFSCQILGQTLPGDERSQITSDILSFIDQGADMVICSGGMSVDPDDRTPGAIKDTGAEISHMEHRFFLVPCFFFPITKIMIKSFLSLVFQAVSCMPDGLYSILFFPVLWPMTGFAQMKLHHMVREDFV